MRIEIGLDSLSSIIPSSLISDPQQIAEARCAKVFDIMDYFDVTHLHVPFLINGGLRLIVHVVMFLKGHTHIV